MPGLGRASNVKNGGTDVGGWGIGSPARRRAGVDGMMWDGVAGVGPRGVRGENVRSRGGGPVLVVRGGS